MHPCILVAFSFIMQQSHNALLQRHSFVIICAVLMHLSAVVKPRSRVTCGISLERQVRPSSCFRESHPPQLSQ